MKIVLATPLYPPDIAPPAPYAKELAKRLADRHEVVVVAYGRLPERVEGVRIAAVDKRRPLPLRLVQYFFALRSAAKNADVLYIQNGPSVELPAGLLAYLTGIPLVMHIADLSAHRHAESSFWLSRIERFALRRAQATLTDSPLPRPEILPFEPRPTEALAAYEASWVAHLQKLEDALNHAR